MNIYDVENHSDGTTLEVVGAQLGCTRENVRKIEQKALEKLTAYATAKLKRPPRDLFEIAGLFARGPDKLGVGVAWADHRAREDGKWRRRPKT